MAIYIVHGLWFMALSTMNYEPSGGGNDPPTPLDEVGFPPLSGKECF